jgi:hypothetical protein
MARSPVLELGKNFQPLVWKENADRLCLQCGVGLSQSCQSRRLSPLYGEWV